MIEYNINYKIKQTTFLSVSYLFMKHGFNNYTRYLQMFAFQDSMSIKGGIVIYHENEDDLKEELIHIENLKAHDYVSNTAIGSVGYKTYGHKIDKADSLLLTVKLNPNFANKLNVD